MWKYKVHANGLSLLRFEPNTMVYQSWDGRAWVSDPRGFGTWSGQSSGSSHYSPIPKDKVPEVQKRIDEYIRRRN